MPDALCDAFSGISGDRGGASHRGKIVHQAAAETLPSPTEAIVFRICEAIW
jgi:hypothetical protein